MLAVTGTGCASPDTRVKREEDGMTKANEILQALGSHPESVAEIEVGTEHWMNGRIKLAVHGDGRVVVTQASRGKTRDFEKRLAPERIVNLGRSLGVHGFLTIAPREGLRQPDDVPVRLTLIAAGHKVHEALVWYGDRQVDAGLDAILRAF